MTRRLFNLTAFLSAVLCAAAAVMWAVSLGRNHCVSYYDGTSMRHLVSHRGTVRAARYQAGSIYGHGWFYESHAAAGEWAFEHPPTRTALGFGWFHDTRTEYSPGYVIPQWTVVVPSWFLVLLTSVLPARWVLARRRLRRGAGFEVRPADHTP